MEKSQFLQLQFQSGHVREVKLTFSGGNYLLKVQARNNLDVLIKPAWVALKEDGIHNSSLFLQVMYIIMLYVAL